MLKELSYSYGTIHQDGLDKIGIEEQQQEQDLRTKPPTHHGRHGPTLSVGAA